MTEPRDAWAEATDRFTALAMKLKLHAEEELGETGVSLKGIGESLTTAISAAAEALSDACHDEAVRQDVRDAGAAVAEALRSSIDAAGRAVRSKD
jgi:hypothetical protein